MGMAEVGENSWGKMETTVLEPQLKKKKDDMDVGWKPSAA